MATKNDPGTWKCYENAEPDEPMFVLLGRDPAACCAVIFWVKMRMEMGQPMDDQLKDARDLAYKMEQWAKAKGKTKELNDVKAAFDRLIAP